MNLELDIETLPAKASKSRTIPVYCMPPVLLTVTGAVSFVFGVPAKVEVPKLLNVVLLILID